MLRLVVTGTRGQVAQSLLRLAPGRAEVIALGRPELDLTAPAMVHAVLARHKPGLIVNAAAYTGVDRAEEEKDTAFITNRDGAAAVAAAAEALGIGLIHLSTDYVFDGRKGAPYDERDETAPLNVYGASKLAGELAVRAVCPTALILRTSWLYSPFGANFVKTMLRLGAERQVLRVVDDQTGCPTSALDLAGAILRIAPEFAANREGGLLHLAGAGAATWCSLARHIFASSAARGGPSPDVEAIGTADYPAPARRPADSRLDSGAFARRFGFALPPWQDSTAEVVRELADG